MTTDVERTARDTTIAQWGVASVVMGGSMAAGGFAFHYLGEPWGLGVATAFAADLALAAWLVISRRLRAVGITSPMGTVLELVTMVMTLYLNIGAAVFQGVNPATAKVLLGIAHSFLPIVLVLVTWAGGEAQLKLLRLRQQRQVEEHTAREARLATERATYEADQRRVDRARADQVRLGELAAAAHELDLTNRREEREERDRHLVASLASVTALGAAWRRRPTRPPQPRSRSVPRRSPRRAPKPTPVSVPVTEELLSQARRVAAERASQGKSAGRAVLQRELNVPETTARELARRLGDQPLLALTGGGH